MARAVTKCPNCGQPVSQFAAGCSICGEDLVAARHRRERRHEALPSVPLRRPSWLAGVSGPEALLGALLLLIAVFFPIIGFFIAGFIAFFAHRNHQTVQRNFALAAVALSLLILILIEYFPWVDVSGPFPQ